MMPIQLSRRLREWRRDQETRNARAEVIANCVLATIPRKRGTKYQWQKFFQREEARRSLPSPSSNKPHHYKSKEESFASIMPWMRQVNRTFGK